MSASRTDCPSWCGLAGPAKHDDQDGFHVLGRSAGRFDLALEQSPDGAVRVSVFAPEIGPDGKARVMFSLDAADAGPLAAVLAELAAVAAG